MVNCEPRSRTRSSQIAVDGNQNQSYRRPTVLATGFPRYITKCGPRATVHRLRASVRRHRRALFCPAMDERSAVIALTGCKSNLRSLCWRLDDVVGSSLTLLRIKKLGKEIKVCIRYDCTGLLMLQIRLGLRAVLGGNNPLCFRVARLMIDERDRRIPWRSSRLGGESPSSQESGRMIAIRGTPRLAHRHGWRKRTGSVRSRIVGGWIRRVKGCWKGFRWATTCSCSITPAGYSASARRRSRVKWPPSWNSKGHALPP